MRLWMLTATWLCRTRGSAEDASQAGCRRDQTCMPVTVTSNTRLSLTNPWHLLMNRRRFRVTLWARRMSRSPGIDLAPEGTLVASGESQETTSLGRRTLDVDETRKLGR